MRNPLQELTTLSERLSSGELPPTHVIDHLIAARSHKRVWGTAWWKAERAKRIGKRCEQCQSEDGPFVLQHLWHPTAIKDIRWSMFCEIKHIYPQEGHRWELFLAHVEAQKAVAEIAIAESIRYLEFNDTQTWCQKCAFLSDKKGMTLCPECRKGYKDSFHPTCRECYQAKLEPCPICKSRFKEPIYPTCYPCSLMARARLMHKPIANDK